MRSCNVPTADLKWLYFVNCSAQYIKKYKRARFQLQSYQYFSLADSLSSAFYQNSEVGVSLFPKHV